MGIASNRKRLRNKVDDDFGSKQSATTPNVQPKTYPRRNLHQVQLLGVSADNPRDVQVPRRDGQIRGRLSVLVFLVPGRPVVDEAQHAPLATEACRVHERCSAHRVSYVHLPRIRVGK